MAVPLAIPIVIGGYELAVLAGTALVALFVASPQGQEATKEAAKAATKALERLRPSPQQKPSPKTRTGADPIVPPNVIEDCPDSEKRKKREMCPVCDQLPNPTPGYTPSYVEQNEVPRDQETLPPLGPPLFERTKMIVKGARVWKGGDGRFYHRDTRHKGKASEIEVYNRNGKHAGTICPQCGAPRKKPDSRKRLPKN